MENCFTTSFNTREGSVWWSSDEVTASALYKVSVEGTFEERACVVCMEIQITPLHPYGMAHSLDLLLWPLLVPSISEFIDCRLISPFLLMPTLCLQSLVLTFADS